MDVFAHTLWANASARGLNIKNEKDGKKKINPAWAGFWGVFPDLFAFVLPTTLVGVAILSGEVSFSDFSHHGPPRNFAGFNIASTLYQYSHSIVVFAFVFLATWAYFKKPRLELLGWLLHILIDIPTHRIEFYPTPFLFPISEYRFPYGFSWGEQWFLIVNYSALLIVFAYFFYFRKKKKN